MAPSPELAVTGSTGHLGGLVARRRCICGRGGGTVEKASEVDTASHYGTSTVAGVFVQIENSSSATRR